MSRRVAQLVLSCVVLGVGVALLLRAALGSDGYSTLINGLSLSLDVPFVAVNAAVGLVLVTLAWSRHVIPGLGTIVQPVVVGFTVSGVMALVAEPDGLVTRGLMLAVAFPVLAVGVAGYLGSGTGAGPTEAAAIAFDPPVPFRWSYGIVQGGGALAGWLLGAAIGLGTIFVIVLLGPMVDLVSRQVRAFRLLGAAIGLGTIFVIVLLGLMVDLVSRQVRAFRLPTTSEAPPPVVGSECD